MSDSFAPNMSLVVRGAIWVAFFFGDEGSAGAPKSFQGMNETTL